MLNLVMQTTIAFVALLAILHRVASTRLFITTKYRPTFLWTKIPPSLSRPIPHPSQSSSCLFFFFFPPLSNISRPINLDPSAHLTPVLAEMARRLEPRGAVGAPHHHVRIRSPLTVVDGLEARVGGAEDGLAHYEETSVG